MKEQIPLPAWRAGIEVFCVFALVIVCLGIAAATWGNRNSYHW